ncbi:MAG: hypothetical protein FD147_1683 [Chloroflexi bacterium]|nr:MAG: hypothetical protein FD147_1683 [Chloroflexota bacterium]MBA4376501.1 hypothetical protein [Anaerolinea sp.]
MKPSMIFYPWKKIRKQLIEMLDQFGESNLDYQPFPSSWSIGKIFLHIAECEDYWIHYVVRKELPPKIRYELKDYPSLNAIKMKLKISQERTESFLETLKEQDLDWRFKTPAGESLTLYEIFWHVLEHEIHHRGELSMILGTLGQKGLDV